MWIPTGVCVWCLSAGAVVLGQYRSKQLCGGGVLAPVCSRAQGLCVHDTYVRTYVHMYIPSD